MRPFRAIRLPTLLLLLAILFGGFVRFMPALVTRFPINDGGLFLDMTRDLQANHYHLPEKTFYNGLDLPYAYPPFGFYAISFLSDLGRIPLLALFLWLPALIATLTIPAFYLLARTLLKDDLRAAVAAMIFALTPRIYSGQIMGGGVTRAFGMLFLLLAVTFVARLFRGQRASPGRFAWPILFCSLAVLSHPQVAIQTAGICAVMWLFFGRTWRGSWHALVVALGVLLLTAPWWGTVLAQHGPAPFLSAMQTGQHGSVGPLPLFLGLFQSGEFLPLLLLLRIVGLLYALWKRDHLLPVLVVTPALVDPRSAVTISAVAFSMLSALALLDFIPSLLVRLRRTEAPAHLLEVRAGNAVLLSLVVMLFIETGLRNFVLINTTLNENDRAAMAWVKENLPPANNFLLITGRQYSMSDPVQEWFPTLTRQRSQTTLQGLEWSLAGGFMPRLNALADLQQCTDLLCVESRAVQTGLTFDYLWVSVPSDGRSAQVVSEVRASQAYQLVYQSDPIYIFARVGK